MKAKRVREAREEVESLQKNRIQEEGINRKGSRSTEKSNGTGIGRSWQKSPPPGDRKTRGE